MNRQILKSAVVALFAIALFSAGCSEVSTVAEEAPYIKPPFPNLDLPFTIFRAQADRDNKFDLPNGGHLKVPANAFVDANGQPITGEVELRYREMHNETDVFLTGIPMEFDSSGRQQLETAGMFELRGAQNGQDIFVREGAKMEVRLASFTPENNFNAYFLDEKARNWKSLGHNSAEVNVEKQKLLSQNQFGLPRAGDRFVLDYTAVLDVEYDEYLNGKSLKHDAVKAKIQSYGLKWLNVQTWYRFFETGADMDGDVSAMVWKRLDDKPFPAWIKQGKVPKGVRQGDEKHLNEMFDPNNNHADVKFVKDNEFSFTIYRCNPKKPGHPLDSFKIRAQAVLMLHDLFRFTPEYWRTNEKEAYAKIKVEYERIRAEQEALMERIRLEREAEMARTSKMADAFRTLEIGGFGIYNYDRLLKQDNITAQLVFQYEDQWAEQGQMVREVYLLPSDSRSVIKLYKNEWAHAPFPVGTKARLVAVLPNSHIAVFSEKQFAAIDVKALRSAEKPQITFDMVVLPNPMASKDDLIKVLQGGG
jgi:hypothetical protein